MLTVNNTKIPIPIAIILSLSRNLGNIFIKIKIPKGKNRTTPEIAPGEYEKVKILNNKCIIPFTKTSVPIATNIKLFLLKI